MTELIDWTFTVEIDYPSEYFPLPGLVHTMLGCKLLGRGLVILERTDQEMLVMIFAVAAPNESEAESIGLNLANQALRHCGLPGITSHRTILEKDEELMNWFMDNANVQELEGYRQTLERWRSRYN